MWMCDFVPRAASVVLIGVGGWVGIVVSSRAVEITVTTLAYLGGVWVLRGPICTASVLQKLQIPFCRGTQQEQQT